MAAPDTAARLQMISMARPPPSMYTVCFRSSRLIRYRCESRSTRKRMSTTFCSRSRSRRPACRSSGRAPSRGFALTRSVGHPSTLPRRCLRSRVGSCTPWPSRPRSQHSTARAAARCRSGSAATTPRLHSKAPPPWAASKRARRHRGCQANKGRSVAPIPLPHPLPHHPPPSLLLRFSRAHVRARGVQANLGTAAALRATKRSSGLQVRRPSTTARNRHTARCGTPRSHPPSLPLPPSRRRPLRSAQRPVPSRRRARKASYFAPEHSGAWSPPGVGSGLAHTQPAHGWSNRMGALPPGQPDGQHGNLPSGIGYSAPPHGLPYAVAPRPPPAALCLHSRPSPLPPHSHPS